MNWIKVRTNLVRDGRVVWLATKLHTHPVFVCGALCWLWSCADEQTTDGKLHGYTPEYVDQQVNLPGFTLALTELSKDGKPSPWASITPDYIGVCEFSKHNGKTAKKRAQAATRASRKRHADSVTPALRNAHLDKSRAEQKREEKNTASKQASEPAEPAPSFSSHGDALLALLRVGFSRDAADGLVTDHGLERVAWAISRLVASGVGKKRNPAGYVRKVLQSPDGPAPPAPVLARLPQADKRQAALQMLRSPKGP